MYLTLTLTPTLTLTLALTLTPHPQPDPSPGIEQEIGHSPLEIPENDAHSPELIALCRGLLNKKPQLRLRIKERRRDPSP